MYFHSTFIAMPGATAGMKYIVRIKVLPLRTSLMSVARKIGTQKLISSEMARNWKVLRTALRNSLSWNARI